MTTSSLPSESYILNHLEHHLFPRLTEYSCSSRKLRLLHDLKDSISSFDVERDGEAAYAQLVGSALSLVQQEHGTAAKEMVFDSMQSVRNLLREPDSLDVLNNANQLYRYLTGAGRVIFTEKGVDSPIPSVIVALLLVWLQVKVFGDPQRPDGQKRMTKLALTQFEMVNRDLDHYYAFKNQLLWCDECESSSKYLSYLLEQYQEKLLAVLKPVVVNGIEKKRDDTIKSHLQEATRLFWEYAANLRGQLRTVLERVLASPYVHPDLGRGTSVAPWIPWENSVERQSFVASRVSDLERIATDPLSCLASKAEVDGPTFCDIMGTILVPKGNSKRLLSSLELPVLPAPYLPLLLQPGISKAFDLMTELCQLGAGIPTYEYTVDGGETPETLTFHIGFIPAETNQGSSSAPPNTCVTPPYLSTIPVARIAISFEKLPLPFLPLTEDEYLLTLLWGGELPSSYDVATNPSTDTQCKVYKGTPTKFESVVDECFPLRGLSITSNSTPDDDNPEIPRHVRNIKVEDGSREALGTLSALMRKVKQSIDREATVAFLDESTEYQRAETDVCQSAAMLVVGSACAQYDNLYSEKSIFAATLENCLVSTDVLKTEIEVVSDLQWKEKINSLFEKIFRDLSYIKEQLDEGRRNPALQTCSILDTVRKICEDHKAFFQSSFSSSPLALSTSTTTTTTSGGGGGGINQLEKEELIKMIQAQQQQLGQQMEFIQAQQQQTETMRTELNGAIVTLAKHNVKLEGGPPPAPLLDPAPDFNLGGRGDQEADVESSVADTEETGRTQKSNFTLNLVDN